MGKTKATTPEERARQRAKEQTDVMWHVATYAIINVFLWTIDIASGGTTWAFWVTAGWGIAVAFHVASFVIDDRAERRTYQRYLAEERQWESSEVNESDREATN